MAQRATVFVGCDVGDKLTEVCVLDERGAVIERRQVHTTLSGITKPLSRFSRATVVIEAGSHSRWIEEALSGAGHKVVVANARQVQLIWKGRKKTDRADALLLARLARIDVSLLAPVKHRSRTAQVDLAALRSREILVRVRTTLFNHVRGMLKPFGVKPVRCATSAFPDRIASEIPPELAPALQPVLTVLRDLNAQIAIHDRQVAQLAAACPTTVRLSQVDGVGDLTALAFRLTIEDPARFKKSRVVPAFLGMTPAKDQSGDSDPEKHITKAGDAFLRHLLVQCAHYMLGPFGKDCDLRRWGLRLSERGGKAAKKRAIVAVARKLAVLLHRLWVTGDTYRPFNLETAAA